MQRVATSCCNEAEAATNYIDHRYSVKDTIAIAIPGGVCGLNILHKSARNVIKRSQSYAVTKKSVDNIMFDCLLEISGIMKVLGKYVLHMHTVMASLFSLPRLTSSTSHAILIPVYGGVWHDRLRGR